MRSTFNILFYLKKSSVKKTGYAPLMVRITINGESALFSLKAEAKPDDWDTKAGRLRSRTKGASDLNAYLDDVRSKIRKHYRELCDRENVVTAAMVRDAFLGISEQKNTLLRLFDQFNEDYKTLVGKQFTEASYRDYLKARSRLHEFLQKKKNRDDISLKDVSPQMITDFERYLFVDCENHRNTVIRYIHKFKRIMVIAHNNGMLSINPFASYKIRYEATDRGYLSEEELTTLMQHTIEYPYMDMLRDVFVFCCFTGLSYCDVKALREENIKQSVDGQIWIMMKRNPTCRFFP